ncbi:MarR family winged helix-turn-helix transcriptional regulator [Pseudodesulfovibrio piezophilus]|uniref:Transcriptional regulator, MarR family n=1 Tax=Pseudodesulfovibrio piezophilus (strain DSM 21447 / JCM 15486 / C1TLV30) TaxID=1322246 RepID=M1WLN9_PSEP2|nr:MarR family transcriptional regulator [Pseudodesulfovibrio piezophilus]CCH48190.1 Transcriptional regulator, MarR family [Pseudodesulfovibrio piezophilus C1TLV30]
MPEIKKLTPLIVEFYERLSSWEHGVVRDKGLTLPQVHALEILGTHKALRMKELAERMGVTTGSLTVLADRLETAGMIRRKPHEEDRRSILVELTDQGQTIFEEHDELHNQLTRDITVNLTRKESSQLAAILEKMICEF